MKGDLGTILQICHSTIKSFQVHVLKGPSAYSWRLPCNRGAPSVLHSTSNPHQRRRKIHHPGSLPQRNQEPGIAKLQKIYEDIIRYLSLKPLATINGFWPCPFVSQRNFWLLVQGLVASNLMGGMVNEGWKSEIYKLQVLVELGWTNSQTQCPQKSGGGW